MKAALKGQTDRPFNTDEAMIEFSEIYNVIGRSRIKIRSAQMKITRRLFASGEDTDKKT